MADRLPNLFSKNYTLRINSFMASLIQLALSKVSAKTIQLPRYKDFFICPSKSISIMDFGLHINRGLLHIALI
jgi:hypothetical protein